MHIVEVVGEEMSSKRASNTYANLNANNTFFELRSYFARKFHLLLSLSISKLTRISFYFSAIKKNPSIVKLCNTLLFSMSNSIRHFLPLKRQKRFEKRQIHETIAGAASSRSAQNFPKHVQVPPLRPYFPKVVTSSSRNIARKPARLGSAVPGAFGKRLAVSA